MAKGEPKRVPELICFDFGGGISIKTEGCLVFLGFHEILIISVVLFVKVIFTIFQTCTIFRDLNLMPNGPPKGLPWGPYFHDFRS